uniref:Dihydrolipoamide acetyltransferase component of pyruvate dehydrogenase complex n=1 Tax=Stygiella incarcerata TaxID=1712417 RepID=A0A192ZI97_9EUKA|nr:branched-chain alphaketoacid dehydrogenase E2 [Stygiella incarcerata]
MLSRVHLIPQMLGSLKPLYRAFLSLKPFILADIGEGIKEVEVLQWFVKPGDKVEQFDPLCEVQSDKATVEITSRFDGTVTKLHYGKGDVALVGKPMCDIESHEESDAEKEETKKEAGTNESLSAGDKVVSSEPSEPSEPSVSSTVSQTSEKVLSTPAVRHLAKEHGIDLHHVHGSGKDHRVLKSDLLSYLDGMAHDGKKSSGPSAVLKQSEASEPAVPPPLGSSSSGSPSAFVRSSDDEEVPVRGLKRTMIKAMQASLAIPHFWVAEEIRMDKFKVFKKQLQDMIAKHGVSHLTYMPLFIKIASLALEEHPILNASLSQDLSTVRYHKHHNIGFAVDGSEGLIVPKIKNVESLSIVDISKEMERLVEQARIGKLSADDLSGGTFSLSNVGPIGGIYGGPVIVPPEVAIAALGRVRRLPRFDENGNVHAEEILPISVSADHRIIDGATLVRFINTFKEMVENPMSIMLHLH